MIPLHHDFQGARVLVFGGGSVGIRRARTFGAEARVLLVSPDFAEDDDDAVERIRARPGPDDITDWLDRFEPMLVVAATDDRAVNDAISRAAMDRGILINRADRSATEPGAVDVPAIVREGDVTVSVGTGGTSPSHSRAIRDWIAAELEDDDMDGVGILDDRTGN